MWETVLISIAMVPGRAPARTLLVEHHGSRATSSVTRQNDIAVSLQSVVSQHMRTRNTAGVFCPWSDVDGDEYQMQAAAGLYSFHMPHANKKCWVWQIPL